MKKILSLAVILSCAFTSLAYADGPNGGNNPGQQQEWHKPGQGGDHPQGGPGNNRQQGPGNNHQQGPDNHHQQGPGNGPQGGPGNNHQNGPQHPQGHQPQGPQHQDRHEQDHFAWGGQDFRRGQPMPERYRGNDYRVNDWNDRGLPPPPQGQNWSYINGNYVLIAAATGIITSILVNGALSH